MRPVLGHERLEALDVVNFAAGRDGGDGKPQAIGSQVDFCREAAARAAKTLVLTLAWAPLLASAECWWARMMVLSII
jgi:hypothetical protein